MANKIVVHYVESSLFKPDWMKGCYKICTVDHPRLGHRYMTTSKVIKDYGNGIFETEWVVYHPVGTDFNDT